MVKKAISLTNVEVSKIRRKELIEASIQCIAQMGMKNASIEKITEMAGVSRGLIRHHFQNKGSLLVAAFQHVCDEYIENIENAIGPHEDPVDQLHAMVDAIFLPPLYEKNLLSVWFEFWLIARRDENLKQIYRTFYSRYLNLVEKIFLGIKKKTKKNVDTKLLAIGFNALTDGLWLEATIDPDCSAIHVSKKVCFDYLERAFDSTT